MPKGAERGKTMKQTAMKLEKDFGTFRITADGRVTVRDLALLQAIREEMQQEAVSEKVDLDVVHVASMTHYNTPNYTTLA
jgi:hypothetical protein